MKRKRVWHKKCSGDEGKDDGVMAQSRRVMRAWCLGEEGREWVCPASQGAPSGSQCQCSGAAACGRRGLGTAVLARSRSRHVLPYMASGSPGECDRGQQTVPPWGPGGVKLSRGPRDMAGVRRKLSCFPRRAVKSQRLVGTLSRAWEPVFLTSSQPGTLRTSACRRALGMPRG